MKIGEMRDVRHPVKSTSSAQKGAGEAGKRGEVDNEGGKAQNKFPLKQDVKEGRNQRKSKYLCLLPAMVAGTGGELPFCCSPVMMGFRS